MSPAVALRTGMCRSMAVCACQRERGREKNPGCKQRTATVCFLMAEQYLRCSQGHPLTYDIHGARLSLSLGRSPSARTDKTGYSVNSGQTPRLCILYDTV